MVEITSTYNRPCPQTVISYEIIRGTIYSKLHVRFTRVAKLRPYSTNFLGLRPLAIAKCQQLYKKCALGLG